MKGIEKRTQYEIIKMPHITEKATYVSEKGVYTFIVDKRANKNEIFDAIKKLFKVTPEKINITNVRGKTVYSRRKYGKKGGFKKAYVYLKEGDKIEII